MNFIWPRHHENNFSWALSWTKLTRTSYEVTTAQFLTSKSSRCLLCFNWRIKAVGRSANDYDLSGVCIYTRLGQLASVKKLLCCLKLTVNIINYKYAVVLQSKQADGRTIRLKFHPTPTDLNNFMSTESYSWPIRHRNQCVWRAYLIVCDRRTQNGPAWN
jgi:hypothetical protein